MKPYVCGPGEHYICYIPRFVAPPPGISSGGTSYIASMNQYYVTANINQYYVSANTVPVTHKKEYVFICPDNPPTTPITHEADSQ